MEFPEYKAFVASMRPPSGDKAAVSRYLAAATRALGARTDADLARTMGLPPATIGSWKKRGIVPQSATDWFVGTLADKIVQYRSSAERDDAICVAAVIELLMRTGGDPMGLGGERGRLMSAKTLGAFIALSRFLFDVHVKDAEGDQISLLADILKVAAFDIQDSLTLA